MPNIIEITVALATSFNNPFESYSNFKPSVQLKATLFLGEDVASATRELQRRAGDMLSEERERILAELKREHDIESAEREVQYAKQRVKNVEDVIAETTAKLADAEWMASAQPYEIEHVEIRQRNCAAEIADLRAAHVEAQKKLADLIGM